MVLLVPNPDAFLPLTSVQITVFINGPGIAVIAVVIDCARVCDDKDKVLEP
jgi:hypothetical protein